MADIKRVKTVPEMTCDEVIVKRFGKRSRIICLLLYLAGLVWFVCLGHADFNRETYVSENALSPGLVYPEVRVEVSRAAASMLDELRREHQTHKTTTPHAWIAAKMQQIGLETHVHNFTLQHPFAENKVHHGKNIYGILRAPRIASTEGIVFSAPYRPPSSVHVDISASVPLLLAFAEFARTKNYWAKDLVFLVTEMEQLGMQAWLEAYHEGDVPAASDAPLKYGNLPARAGALQAALNLEIQDLDYDYVDIKLHGLNGKLPNLDMFNLVHRVMTREYMASGYKYNSSSRNSEDTILGGLRSMSAMLFSQASGVPDGNHGLFHGYRIEAVTLEAVKRTKGANQKYNRNPSTVPLLKAIEGISRSLNNLLERFHQSFFFYIIVKNDRFVSIGDYMLCLAALSLGLIFKAFIIWNSSTCQHTRRVKESAAHKSNEGEDNITPQVQPPQPPPKALPFKATLLYVVAMLAVGYLSYALPILAQHYIQNSGFSAPTIILLTLWVVTVFAACIPVFVTLPEGGATLLHIGLLTYYAIALLVVGLLNFGLSFFLATITVPFLIFIEPDETTSTVRRILTIFCSILLNPLVVAYIIVLVLTIAEFPELSLAAVLIRAGSATMDAITFAMADWLIYKNWLYVAATCALFPAWTILWTLAVCKESHVQAPPAKVTTKLD